MSYNRLTIISMRLRANVFTVFISNTEIIAYTTTIIIVGKHARLHFPLSLNIRSCVNCISSEIVNCFSKLYPDTKCIIPDYNYINGLLLHNVQLQ